MIHDGKTRKLPFDPAEALAHLRASDPKLGALIDKVGEFKLRLDRSPSPFESLLESILYQQLHGKAAATIHRRVREFFHGDPTPQQLLDTPDEPLRAAGVSGNKITAMRDLAAKTLDGTVPSHKAILKMPDADIVERLTEVRGIGPWTVEMLLIFRLGRPDVPWEDLARLGPCVALQPLGACGARGLLAYAPTGDDLPLVADVLRHDLSEVLDALAERVTSDTPRPPSP